MKITLYIINWNDSFYLPFIKNHYGEFCQRIVMYDNHSNDNSVMLAKELGFEVRTFGYSNRLDDQDYLNVKNECWKEERLNGQRSDYVIVCDVDEFLVIDRLEGICPKVIGYNMISEDLPVKDIFEVNTGAHSYSYSKQVIFSPKRMKEINFVHGCHQNNKVAEDGLSLEGDGHCRLYHFRQIGGVHRLIDRHADYRTRMSKFNLKHGMGVHYLHSDENKRTEWELLKSEAKKLW